MRPHRRFAPNRGSHLPALMKLVSMTTGPILEMGCGLYSTTPLHWACYTSKRRLVTYENNSDFTQFLMAYESSSHETHIIDDWDSIDLSEQWSIAFLDHAPGPRRGIDAMRLSHVDYLVIHDSENSQARAYGLNKVYRNFKYRYKYNDAYPHTSIWSNKHDVRGFKV